MVAVSRGLQASDRENDDLEKKVELLHKRLQEVELSLQERTVQHESSLSEAEKLMKQVTERSVLLIDYNHNLSYSNLLLSLLANSKLRALLTC